MMLFTEPLTTIADCAAGRHTWKQTTHTGIAVCKTCGIMGYCPSCSRGDIPSGSPVRPCRFHRHAGLRLHECLLPVSAVRSIQ